MHLRAKKTVGQQFNTETAQRIEITPFCGAAVEASGHGWCIDTIQTGRSQLVVSTEMSKNRFELHVSPRRVENRLDMSTCVRRDAHQNNVAK